MHRICEVNFELSLSLVEKVLLAKASNSRNTARLEAELEVEIAALYGLSDADLLIVQEHQLGAE